MISDYKLYVKINNLYMPLEAYKDMEKMFNKINYCKFYHCVYLLLRLQITNNEYECYETCSSIYDKVVQP